MTVEQPVCNSWHPIHDPAFDRGVVNRYSSMALRFLLCGEMAEWSKALPC